MSVALHCQYHRTLMSKIDERGIYLYCKRCKHERYYTYDELMRLARAQHR